MALPKGPLPFSPLDASRRNIVRGWRAKFYPKIRPIQKLSSHPQPRPIYCSPYATQLAMQLPDPPVNVAIVGVRLVQIGVKNL